MAEVTVVIPTRDRSVLLRRTLQSVQRQVDVELEVVVVDDGSRDDTADVVARLGDPRVRLTRHERPQGVSAARNRGIALATGEWVALLDDDDLWAPDKLAAQLCAARHLGRQWACSGSVDVTDALEVVSGGPPPSPEAIVRQLPLRNVVPAGASNVVVRRRALEKTGVFDTLLKHIADWDLWIRLAATLGPPAVVDAPQVAYRLHAGNASTDAGAMAAELARVAERHQSLRRGAPIDLAYAYRWAAWHYLRTGRRGAAVRAYARAAAAGDVRSVARALVACLDPDIARRRQMHYLRDRAWAAQAVAWLREVPGT
jgi:glycosyltransferase involved in cell wall biosynthesis